MPHQFDCGSFGQLVRDAQKLHDSALTLQAAIARLEVSSPSTQSSSRETDDAWRTARTASLEQVVAAEGMVCRLIGSAERVSRDRPIVLIVDDSPAVREATALLLEGAGFRAVTAANGLEALLVAHYAHPAVVLLDLMMPILDGFQTARLLNESPATIGMRVIAYSGRTDLLRGRLPRSFAAALPKPTTAEELLTAVEQQTSSPASRAELA